MYLIHSKPKGYKYKDEHGNLVPCLTASLSKKRFTLAAEFEKKDGKLMAKFGLSVFRNTTIPVCKKIHTISVKDVSNIPLEIAKYGNNIIVAEVIDTPVEFFNRKIGRNKAIAKLTKHPLLKEYEENADPRIAFLQEFDVINANPVNYYQENFKKKAF